MRKVGHCRDMAWQGSGGSLAVVPIASYMIPPLGVLSERNMNLSVCNIKTSYLSLFPCRRIALCLSGQALIYATRT